MNTKAVLAWLVGLGLFASALLWAQRYDRGGTRITLEDALPDRLAFVVTFDAERLRREPWMVSLTASEGQSLTSALRPCGFDLVSRVERGAFVVPEQEESGAFAVAATVRVTRTEIEACANVFKGSAPQEDRGFYISRVASRALAYRPTSSERGLVLFGDDRVVASMIEATSGARPRFASSAGHREVRAALASDGAALVFSAVLPRALRDRLRSELGANETQMAAILAVEAAGLSATPDLAGGMTFSAMLFSETAAATPDVRDWAAKQVDRAKRNLGMRFLLGSAFEGVSIVLADRRVVLKVHVTRETFDRIANFLAVRSGSAKTPGDAGPPPGFSP